MARYQPHDQEGISRYHVRYWKSGSWRRQRKENRYDQEDTDRTDGHDSVERCNVRSVLGIHRSVWPPSVLKKKTALLQQDGKGLGHSKMFTLNYTTERGNSQ